MSDSERVLKEPLKSIGAQDILKLEYSRSGFIRKEGRFERKLQRVSSVRWRQYFVVLSQGCAYIFNDEGSTSPKKCFSLKSFDKIERFAIEGASYMNFCFRLVSSYEDDKEKTINFACSDDTQRKEWMKYFYLEIRKANHLKTDVPTETYGEIEQNIHDRFSPGKQSRLSSMPSSECESDDNDDYDKVVEKATTTTRDTTKRYIPDPTGRTLPPIPRSASQDSGPSSPLSPEAGRGSDRREKLKSPPPDNSPMSPGPQKAKQDTEGTDKKKQKPPVAPKPARLRSPEPVYGNIGRSYGNLDLRGAPEEEDVPPSDDYDDVMQEISIFEGEADDASRVIRFQEEGVFLIRKGSGTPHVLVVKCGKESRNYRIFENDNGKDLRIVKENACGPRFDSLIALVEFYMENNIPNTNTKLTRQYVQS